MKQIPEISPTFCVSPWMETAIASNSILGICCFASPIKDIKGRMYNLMEDRLKDFWNSEALREIRKKMLKGEKVSACWQCYRDESVGRISKRQEFNKIWLEKQEMHGENAEDILDRVKKSKINNYRVEKSPLRLDIRPANLCNLKCRMCWPRDSSKVAKEQKELFKNSLYTEVMKDQKYFTPEIDEKSFNWGEKKREVWEDIYKWSPGMKDLYFTGGEPTLIKEIWDYIDYLKERKLAKGVHLTFNTNGMQNPDKLIRIFDCFQSIGVNFSIDGHKEVNEYIRYPSKWLKIEDNIMKVLKKATKNIYLHVITVIQTYNILDLPRFFKWTDNLKIKRLFNICAQPDFLDINFLPNNVKKKALLKLKDYEATVDMGSLSKLKQLAPIKDILKSKEKPGIEKHLKDFYKYTKILDRHRGNNFERTFPELNALLNEDGRWRA